MSMMRPIVSTRKTGKANRAMYSYLQFWRSAPNGWDHSCWVSVRGIQFRQRSIHTAPTCRGEVCNIDTSSHSYSDRINNFLLFDIVCTASLAQRTCRHIDTSDEFMRAPFGGKRFHGRWYRAARRQTLTHMCSFVSVICASAMQAYNANARGSSR